MTTKQIALSTLVQELKQFTQRPYPLVNSLLNLLITQQDNKPLHSDYITPLKGFFKKVNKEDYIKQVSNSYTVGKTSKKYLQGKELKRLKNKIIQEITLSALPINTSTNTDILIHKDNLQHLKDFWPVMKITSTVNDFYSILLEAKQESVYFDFTGRQYNNFNRLSQHDRKLTNTPYEIDLSSSVQNLFINQYAFIKSISYEEALEKFPAHKEYITKKQQTRDRVAKEENKTIVQIKKDITKISFRGGTEKDYNGFMLKLFKETQEVTKPILELINRIDNRTPIKNHIIQRTNSKHPNNSYKFRTKLFFWYEYQENIIRQAMLDFINNPNTKQVHDAIYTEEELHNKEELKEYINEQTGFTVNF